jgi:hypothetical protein
MSDILKWAGLLIFGLSLAVGIAVVAIDFLMAVSTFGIVDLVPSALVVSLIIIPIGTALGAVTFAIGAVTAQRSETYPRKHGGMADTRT